MEANAVMLDATSCRNHGLTCCMILQVEMSTRSTNRSFKKLITERDDVSPEDIYQALCKQEVELVFTAHPTQVLPASIQVYAVYLPTISHRQCF